MCIIAAHARFPTPSIENIAQPSAWSVWNILVHALSYTAQCASDVVLNFVCVLISHTNMLHAAARAPAAADTVDGALRVRKSCGTRRAGCNGGWRTL